MKEIPFERSSFPVLAIDDNRDKLKGVGTCTLARAYNDNLFLLNAAHTLDTWGNNSPLFIASPNREIIELPFALKTKSATVDKVDIAVTPLLGEFAKQFYGGEISSLPLYDDFPIYNFKNHVKRVVFFGYPSSASRFSIDLKRNQIKAKSISITSTEINTLSDKIINLYDIDFTFHIVANFERRNMKDQTGKFKVSPLPYGISGGAVYFAYVEVGESVDIFKGIEFAGIGNEYLKNISVIKATKKSAILSFINKHFR